MIHKDVPDRMQGSPPLTPENNPFSDLRFSPSIALLGIGLSGAFLYVVSVAFQYSIEFQDQLITIAVCLLGILISGWLILGVNDLLGRWFICFSLAAMFILVGFFEASPHWLALAAISVGLSGVMISTQGSVILAIVETSLFLALHFAWLKGYETYLLGLDILLVWMMQALIAIARKPIYEVLNGSWRYYNEAQQALQEARGRQAQLNMALEDLAKANVQLRRMNDMVDGLRRVAEEAHSAKEQFVANVSHELRTPLNMVIGYSDMILKTPNAYGSKVPSALLADLTVIQRNASHLSDLINDVLDLSQVDAGMMALSKSDTNIAELIEAAIVAIRPLFEMKGLYIEKEISDDIPPVFCDQIRIREVLLNLISNAGRFTQQGGVHIRAWRDTNDIFVSVADTGPGIEANKLDLLFKPFQQLDGSIRRQHGGTGLGLSISKRFLELHGGSIWVESDVNRGTTFTFRLPLHPQIGLQGAIADSFRRVLKPEWEFYQRTHPYAAPQVEVQPKVMVMDEGRFLSRVLKRYLHGIEVVEVRDLAGIRKTLSDDPCQMLVINEPSIGTALQQLDNAELPPHLPVLVCSVPGSGQYSSSVGISEYLVKPITQEVLLEALERLGLSGKSVLIVDDDPEVLRLFRQMLVSSPVGYRVSRARDGEEALITIRRKRPDAIVMDMVMPHMDGYKFLEIRSQDPTLSKIPVIAVTARDPFGQPILSRSLAIAKGDGFSVYHLLQFIRVINEVFSPQGQLGGPKAKEAPSG